MIVDIYAIKQDIKERNSHSAPFNMKQIPNGDNYEVRFEMEDKPKMISIMGKDGDFNLVGLCLIQIVDNDLSVLCENGLFISTTTSSPASYLIISSYSVADMIRSNFSKYTKLVHQDEKDIKSLAIGALYQKGTTNYVKIKPV